MRRAILRTWHQARPALTASTFRPLAQISGNQWWRGLASTTRRPAAPSSSSSSSSGGAGGGDNGGGGGGAAAAAAAHSASGAGAAAATAANGTTAELQHGGQAADDHDPWRRHDDPWYDEDDAAEGRTRNRGVFLAGVVVGAVALGGYKWYTFDDKEHESFLRHMFSPIYGVYDSVIEFNQPTTLLLPPEAPTPAGERRRTLVLNVNGTLVQSCWTRREGWRVRVRPEAEDFLRRMFKAGYEIVIFASQLSHVVEPVITALDREGLVDHRLFKFHTTYKGGQHIKNLARLNRDLARVVLVDHLAESARLQPENHVPVPEFTDDPDDRELAKIASFLEDLARYDVVDVRPKIAQWRQLRERERLLEAARRNGGQGLLLNEGNDAAAGLVGRLKRSVLPVVGGGRGGLQGTAMAGSTAGLGTAAASVDADLFRSERAELKDLVHTLIDENDDEVSHVVRQAALNLRQADDQSARALRQQQQHDQQLQAGGGSASALAAGAAPSTGLGWLGGGATSKLTTMQKASDQSAASAAKQTASDEDNDDDEWEYVDDDDDDDDDDE